MKGGEWRWRRWRKRKNVGGHLVAFKPVYTLLRCPQFTPKAYPYEHGIPTSLGSLSGHFGVYPTRPRPRYRIHSKEGKPVLHSLISSSLNGSLSWSYGTKDMNCLQAIFEDNKHTRAMYKKINLMLYISQIFLDISLAIKKSQRSISNIYQIVCQQKLVSYVWYPDLSTHILILLRQWFNQLTHLHPLRLHYLAY